MRFVLIHGAFHGAWCWEKVAVELNARGHETVAIDLPGSGERVRERAGLEAYRHEVADLVQDGDVLVGHSIGCSVVTMAADEVPDKVARVVYIAGPAPIEGRTWLEAVGLGGERVARHIKLIDTPRTGRAFVMRDLDGAAEVFYHDCSPEDQKSAFERLTPQQLEPYSQPVHLQSFWQANIPCSYVLCTDDRSHPLAADREWMGRLGLVTCVGLNASHSPFLSCPRETAAVIESCADGTFDVVSAGARGARGARGAGWR